MAVVNLIVGASTDDARNLTPNSTFTATAATHHLGNFSGSIYYIGWRFTGVTIPQGATISSAVLTMYVSNVNGGTTALVSFWGEASDSAATFSSGATPQNRTHTAAQVNQTFTTANWGTVGYQATSTEIPELASLVQEVVNRAGWASGNSLVIVATNNGSTNPGYVGHATWDNSSVKATKLDITYTVGTTTSTSTSSSTSTSTSSTSSSTSTSSTSSSTSTSSTSSSTSSTSTSTSTSSTSTSTSSTSTSNSSTSTSTSSTSHSTSSTSTSSTSSSTSTSSTSSSTSTSTTTVVGAPVAPSNLVAVVSGANVNLTWTDNSGIETGYVLQRQRGVSPNYYTIATLAANTTSYSDTTVNAGYTYTYQVKATGSTGDSPYTRSNLVTLPGTKTWTAYSMAWIYPGDPATNANMEVDDGRIVHFLKPEYFTITSGGALQQLYELQDGVNAYSLANVKDLKKRSSYQFVTVSGSYANIFTLVGNTANETAAITTLVNFCLSSGFSGVELDWEGYGSWTATQYTNYKNFVSNLGTQLHNNGKMLMIDGPPIGDASVYSDLAQSLYKWKYEDFDSVTQVDFIAMLLYDYEFDFGAGSSVQPVGWAQTAINWFKTKVTDQNRIVIGIPSYGYHGTTGGFTITIDTKAQSSLRTGFGTATRNSDFEMNWINAGVSNLYQDSIGLDAKRETIEDEHITHVSVWHLGGNDWFTNKVELQQTTTSTSTSSSTSTSTSTSTSSTSSSTSTSTSSTSSSTSTSSTSTSTSHSTSTSTSSTSTSTSISTSTSTSSTSTSTSTSSTSSSTSTSTSSTSSSTSTSTSVSTSTSTSTSSTSSSTSTSTSSTSISTSTSSTSSSTSTSTSSTSTSTSTSISTSTSSTSTSTSTSISTSSTSSSTSTSSTSSSTSTSSTSTSHSTSTSSTSSSTSTSTSISTSTSSTSTSTSTSLSTSTSSTSSSTSTSSTSSSTSATGTTTSVSTSSSTSTSTSTSSTSSSTSTSTSSTSSSTSTSSTSSSTSTSHSTSTSSTSTSTSTSLSTSTSSTSSSTSTSSTSTSATGTTTSISTSSSTSTSVSTSSTSHSTSTSTSSTSSSTSTSSTSSSTSHSTSTSTSTSSTSTSVSTSSTSTSSTSTSTVPFANDSIRTRLRPIGFARSDQPTVRIGRR